MPRLRWGPSAFVLAAIALFISLGGTGYALTQTNGPQPAGQTARTALPAWHNLSLRGTWTYGGFDSYHAGYYKDAQHVVHLRGSAKNGSTAAPAFRLPAGARPAHTLWLTTYAFGGSAGGLEIQPSGMASFFDSVGGGNASGYSSLDGVSFRVP
jgi:hypothetical protein